MSQGIEIASRMERRERQTVSLPPPELKSPLDFSRRIPELDGLRGVAIGMVIFLHCVTFAIVARPPELLGYVYASTKLFWTGVDLFFVLSGFLIGGILIDARESPNYFKTFYIRRCCRILPAYFLFLSFVGIAYRYIYLRVGAPLDGVFAGKLPWYAYLSFAQNFWMTRLNTIGAPILSITWSLAIEEQFYLVLPTIIRFVRRSALPYVFIAGAAIAPILRLIIAYRFPGNLWANYVLLPCRMDSLFLGALCAYFVREPGTWNWLVKRRSTIWMAFFALLAGMGFLNTLAFPFRRFWEFAGYGWIALFFATTLILVLTDSQNFLSRAMRFRWLEGLGGIAYSVYLFHVAVYSFCNWLSMPHGWPLRTWRDFEISLLGVAITIIFGKFSWKFFEKPILDWSHRWEY